MEALKTRPQKEEIPTVLDRRPLLRALDSVQETLEDAQERGEERLTAPIISKVLLALHTVANQVEQDSPSLAATVRKAARPVWRSPLGAMATIEEVQEAFMAEYYPLDAVLREADAEIEAEESLLGQSSLDF